MPGMMNQKKVFDANLKFDFPAFFATQWSIFLWPKTKVRPTKKISSRGIIYQHLFCRCVRFGLKGLDKN